MEITLLVSPGGSITLHCDFPFVHKLIALEELESEIEKLIQLMKDEEKLQDEKDADDAFEKALDEKIQDEIDQEEKEKKRTFGL